ncbi:MAG: hypothetical protein JO210_15780 [Acidobacteriaceae bacterium]|nr:hypothetical protein [Acidobacteriaceae bacterium]
MEQNFISFCGNSKVKMLYYGRCRLSNSQFDIAEPTASRYLQTLKQRGDPQKAKRWQAFLHNHRKVIAAMDFFTVPTMNFRVLYCFFVIKHSRRRILGPYHERLGRAATARHVMLRPVVIHFLSLWPALERLE